MRIPQPGATRGSLRHIQICVNDCPALIQPAALPPIRWVSPLARDAHAEYRDAAFLHRLGLASLAPALKAFWPTRGPQWDALGLTQQGPVLLEAKAHLSEFRSPPSKAGPKSAAQIARAFAKLQADLGIIPKTDWSRTHYQYANRLTFLWWLRAQGLDAKLIFASFLNDAQMNGPTKPAQWHSAFAAANAALGLPHNNPLTPHIHHLTPDLRTLPTAASH